MKTYLLNFQIMNNNTHKSKKTGCLCFLKSTKPTTVDQYSNNNRGINEVHPERTTNRNSNRSHTQERPN